MPTATCRARPGIRPKPDLLARLIDRLDQQRRAATRRGLIELAVDLREAARFLRVMQLDEREASDEH
jgi:hypothetical protein